MTKKLTGLRALLAAIFLAVPLSANAGLLGSTVTGTPLFPNTSTLGGTGHAAGPFTVVDPGLEFPEGEPYILYSGNIDITDNQIRWIPTVSATYLTADFNGFMLKFFGAPAITNVVLDPASALAATSISFTSDTVLLNFSGKTVFANEPAIFDVNPTPEPGTFVLFGLGLAGLGAVRRWKLAA